MKHSNYVKGYDGPHEQLAEEIGDLYYDSLADLLRLLADKINRDGNMDAARGRSKLAGALHDCSSHLQQAAEAVDLAWEICKPYTKAQHKSAVDTL